jgi:uncharacterized delta-60 repeat protein
MRASVLLGLLATGCVVLPRAASDASATVSDAAPSSSDAAGRACALRPTTRSLVEEILRDALIDLRAAPEPLESGIQMSLAGTSEGFATWFDIPTCTGPEIADTPACYSSALISDPRFADVSFCRELHCVASGEWAIDASVAMYTPAVLTYAAETVGGRMTYATNPTLSYDVHSDGKTTTYAGTGVRQLTFTPDDGEPPVDLSGTVSTNLTLVGDQTTATSIDATFPSLLDVPVSVAVSAPSAATADITAGGDTIGHALLSLDGTLEVEWTPCADGALPPDAGPVEADAGPFDPTFGVDGVARISNPDGPDGYMAVRDLALAADGKILFAIDSDRGVEAGRLGTDGKTDDTFGAGGFASDPAAIYAGVSTAILPEPDGTYLLLGSELDSGVLVHLLADGAFDTRAPLATGTLGHAAMTPDGELVAVDESPTTPRLVKLTASGVVDPAFGSSGSVPILQGPDGLAVQPDGKIVTTDYHSVQRFAIDGTPDATFGTGGSFSTAGLAVAADVVVLADGRIAVAGEPVLVLTADGALDHTAPVIFPGPSLMQAITGQPDDTIVVGGSVGSPTGAFGLARLGADGSTIGIITTALGQINDEIYAVRVQPDGKIVAAGSSRPDAVIVRYGP